LNNETLHTGNVGHDQTYPKGLSLNALIHLAIS